ncbi:hypothetical protein [Flectobacillus roseus]|uniref:hypothetical protein n=1 Tax=Flectobacillus roseus TaxID=502259 RepID=UPI0024B64F6F|nr:hypothetical protein [Flectobacillus roseus]MDI9871312.1 hypothetical protein [Flectobacillus roseus]
MTTREQLLATAQDLLKPNAEGKITEETILSLMIMFLQYSVDSSFEVWRESNPQGTKQQFLDYIIGPKGDKGDKGDIGEPGANAEFLIGNWDASTNTPVLTNANWPPNGHYYRVSGAGNSTVTGASLYYAIDDKLISTGTGWLRAQTEFTQNWKVTSNDTYKIVFYDEDDNVGLGIKHDGSVVLKLELADGSVLTQNLSNDIVDRLLTYRASTSINARAVFIDEDDNMPLEFTEEGKVKGLFDYSLSKIGKEDVKDELLSMMMSFNDKYDGFNQWLAVMIDEDDNIGFGVMLDGTVVLSLALANNSIELKHLSTELQARFPTASFINQNSYNPNNNVFSDEDDDLWRGEQVDVPVFTNRMGYLFTPFPPLKGRGLMGNNSNTSALEFRKKPAIVVRGERNLGTFTPLTTLTTYKGWFRSDATTLPANPQAGDYYICIFFYLSAKTRTLQGVTMSEWDILYYTAQGWSVAASPASSSTLKDNDYFDATSNGKWFNTTVNQGDRLIYLGLKSGGGWNEPIWITQKVGEYFCQGTCNPNAFAPVAPKNHDFWVVESNGVYQGLTLKKGDYLIYNNGWGVDEATIVNVPASAFYSLPCLQTSEWAVRRADLSTARLDVNATTRITKKKERAGNDWNLVSDSMFGSGNVGGQIAALLPKSQVTIQSFGGATSYNILSKVKESIRSGDLYFGRNHVYWHGQNNNGDLVQIKNASLQMASLAGIDRVLFWSMLGPLSMSWNSTRLVDSNHEDAYLGLSSSRFLQLEQWYEKVFPGQWFSPRKATLAAAVGRTRKSLQFPGKTEAQVALEFGIPPFSFFFNFTSVDWNPDELNFTGYHPSAGLPTGGNHNDYVIRTGNGTIGQIIVNQNGVWTEYNHDTTHVTNEGGAALANQFVNVFLTQTFKI